LTIARYHVGYVVGLCAWDKVCWVAAQTHIAGVAHNNLAAYASMGSHVRNSVRHSGCAAYVEVSVTTAVTIHTRKEPAIIGAASVNP